MAAIKDGQHDDKLKIDPNLGWLLFIESLYILTVERWQPKVWQLIKYVPPTEIEFWIFCFNFFWKFLGGLHFFLLGYRYPVCFGLLVMSALYFKARVDSLVYVLHCMCTMEVSDSPLMWHLTPWQSACQESHFDPHACIQALAGSNPRSSMPLLHSVWQVFQCLVATYPDFGLILHNNMFHLLWKTF